MIRHTIVFAAVVLAAAVQATGQDAKPLRVYFVGNSVTDTINYSALAELAKSRGFQQIWGRHMIPRCSAPVDLGTSAGRISGTALRPLPDRTRRAPMGCSQPPTIRPASGWQRR